MYHTEIKNQASIQKNLNKTRFSSKDLHTDHYTSTKHKIYKHIINNPYNASNAYLAKIAGCSIRTVTRITTQLHKDGLVTRYQEHRYSFNNYIPRMIVDHENEKIFQSENVYLKKDLILEEYLSSSLYVVLEEGYTDSKMRARQSVTFRHELTFQPVTKRHDITANKVFKNKKKEKLVDATLKNMILDNKHDQKTQEALRTPKIWEEIITPTIQAISTLFQLNEQEQFKLVAFREDVLQHTLEQTKAAIAKYNGTGYKMQDRLQWIVRTAINYSKENNIKIDWSWYYDLCSILSINREPESRPLQFSGTPNKTSYKGEYGGPHKQVQSNSAARKYINDAESLPDDERLRRLKVELKAREERFSIYSGSFLDKKMMDTIKKDIEALEGSSSEKQKVQYTNNTNTLAEDGEECEPVLRSFDQRQSFLWPVPKPTAWG